MKIELKLAPYTIISKFDKNRCAYSILIEKIYSYVKHTIDENLSDAEKKSCNFNSVYDRAINMITTEVITRYSIYTSDQIYNKLKIYKNDSKKIYAKYIAQNIYDVTSQKIGLEDFVILHDRKTDKKELFKVEEEEVNISTGIRYEFTATKQKSVNDEHELNINRSKDNIVSMIFEIDFETGELNYKGDNINE